MKMLRKNIAEIISEETGISTNDFKVEIPENSDFGDYSSNIAMQIASKVKEKKNPREIAEDIVKKLNKNTELVKFVEKIVIADPGFINFWLSKDTLLNNLIQIVNKSDNYGKGDFGKGKKVIIDCSSPNIAKSFSIGHLRSTIIGQALNNVYKYLGYKTIADNHLGDWGTQFGKLLYMIDNEKLGKKDLDIEKLEELYIKFHELASDPTKTKVMEDEARKWFKMLEDGDKKARELWKFCVDVSMEEFEEIYKILGVSFDYQYGESFYEEEMKLLEADKNVREHLTVGEDGKSQIIKLEKEGIKTPLMFKKSDGGTTYATRDLACLRFRSRKWEPDIVIYEVGAEQTLHFQQVFAAARKLGLINKKVFLYHTKHGLYLSPDGKKFRTRKGGVVKLEDILEDAINRARKIIEKSETSRGIKVDEVKNVAEMVGIGAVKYFDLMHSVASDIVFDWEKVMNLEGNSGPYLQYTFARTQSVLHKAKTNKKLTISKKDDVEINAEELILLRSLARFSGAMADAAKNYSPNIICNYLFDLAQKFNNFYSQHKIIGSENQEFRITLTTAVGQIIKNGLTILGIKTPERM